MSKIVGAIVLAKKENLVTDEEARRWLFDTLPAAKKASQPKRCDCGAE